MAKFRSTFSWPTHGGEKNTTSGRFPLFLARQSLTIWVSSISTFVIFVDRCVEHARSLFQFRPFFRSFVLYYHPVLYQIARVLEHFS